MVKNHGGSVSDLKFGLSSRMLTILLSTMYLRFRCLCILWMFMVVFWCIHCIRMSFDVVVEFGIHVLYGSCHSFVVDLEL